MMDALQTLQDNGCTGLDMEKLLNDIIAADDFNDGDDKRCCIALLWDIETDTHYDPASYSIAYDDIVSTPGAEYLVLDDGEAKAACKEYIEQSLWAFSSDFLADETGIDENVFETLVDLSEDANDAIRSLINGSCGIDSFVKGAIDTDGRGHFLAGYDGEECKVSAGDTYYIYRVN